MNDTLLSDAARAVLRRLQASTFESEVVISSGLDPEEGTRRLQLHVFDAPHGDRRGLEDTLLDLALEVEDEVPASRVSVFVHDSDIAVSVRCEILESSRKRYLPRVSVNVAQPTWNMTSTACTNMFELSVAA